MEYFRLQVGCLAVLIYVAVVYLQGCMKYHVEIAGTHFRKLFLLLIGGVFTVIADGALSWTVGNAANISPIWSYVCHALAFIGLDFTIFCLAIYMLNMMECYPKKRAYLLYLAFALNIALVILTIGLPDYFSGKAQEYTSGPATVICFGMIGFYITVTCLMSYKNFKLIKNDKRRGIITILYAYAIISVLQMIFADSLASMSIGLTILILGIYLNSEDPAAKELGRYYSETVMSFANLIEERDGSTGGHIKRTSRYVGLIVEGLRRREEYQKILTRDYIDNLLEAAPMHDVGKIAIPDSILQKPGKLDDAEYAVMKTHAEKGGKIIRENFGKFLEEDYCNVAYHVARYHHEKWNGRGYPDGLKGEEIPLEARIMAVADVFDAVSEKRCYRDAMPMDKCFEIIAQGRGTDFDPVIVDVFLGLRAEVEKAHQDLDLKAEEKAAV